MARGGENKGAVIAIVVAILAAMFLVGVLKVAFKIVLLGIVAVAAVAAFYAVKDRIGGPRA